ncbi:4409_t:CDS:1, partial [Scutellospora calospora]
MNNTILSIENIYDEVLCSDPDKDYEVLDDSIGDDSESLKQLTTPFLSSAHSTSN